MGYNNWHNLSVNLPIVFSNVTSQYQMLLLLCDHLNTIAYGLKDLEQTVADADAALSTADQNLRYQLQAIDKQLAALDLKLSKTVLEINDMLADADHRYEMATADAAEKLQKSYALLQQAIDLVNTLETRMSAWKLETEQSLNMMFNAYTRSTTDLVEHSMNSALRLIDDTYIDIRAKLDKQINTLYEQFAALQQFVDSMQDNLLVQSKAYIDEIFKTRTMYYVTNPITGKVEDVNKVLRMLWQFTTNALTCAEYRVLHITCAEYRSFKLTCLEYLRLMRWFAYEIYIKQIMTMYNPVTGTYQSIPDVILSIIQAAEIRSDSVSNKQFLDYGVVNDVWRNLKVTTGDFMWHSRSILDAYRQGGIINDTDN